MLRGREKADVAIAGGGLTGLSCALWLSRVGLKVALAEAEQMGWGASGSCTGMVVSSGCLFASKMEKQQGNAALEAWVHTQQKAVQSIRELSDVMRFGWMETNAFLFSQTRETTVLLEQEAESLKRAGAMVQMEQHVNAPLPAQAVLKMSGMGVLHTEKYLAALAEAAVQAGARLHGQSRVTAVETNRLCTQHGSIEAPYLIMATGYPIINVPGWYFLRMEQRNQQRITLSGGIPFDGIYCEAHGQYALRGLHKGALMHVSGQRVGTKQMPVFHEAISSAGMEIAAQPENAIESFTADGLPFIGPYGRKTPNLFVASGYGGMGITGSMIAAQAISARILGLPSDGYEIYSAQHKPFDTLFAAQSAGRLLKGKMHGEQAPRCSHMGCRLQYNPHSHLWECPCHGSCFDDLGRVLHAPAVHPARLGKRK